MKRIYVRPITEQSPLESFQLLVNSRGSGPSGGDGLLPSFSEKETVLVERGDYTRTQLWDDPDANGNGSGIWQ